MLVFSRAEQRNIFQWRGTKVSLIKVNVPKALTELKFIGHSKQLPHHAKNTEDKKGNNNSFGIVTCSRMCSFETVISGPKLTYFWNPETIWNTNPISLKLFYWCLYSNCEMRQEIITEYSLVLTLGCVLELFFSDVWQLKDRN